MMPLIGTVDFLAEVLVLFLPLRIALWYMVIWGTCTAFLRPIIGLGISEFLERAGNYGVPLALLWWSGLSFKKLWSRAEFGPLSSQTAATLSTVLQVTSALLLLGHGNLLVFYNKQLLQMHLFATGIIPASSISEAMLYCGMIDFLLAGLVLFLPSTFVVLGVCLWKICIESLFLTSGDYVWEFIERGGSYAAPLALYFIRRECQRLESSKLWQTRLFEFLRKDVSSKYERAWGLSLAFILVCCFLSGRAVGTARVDHPLGIVNPVVLPLLSGTELRDELRLGRAKIFFRHFQSGPDLIDSDTLQWQHHRLSIAAFENCAWQRTLTPYGIRRAKLVGEAIRKLGIPIGDVVSSPYCRCVSSAKFISGREPIPLLSLLFRRGEYTRARMETAHDMLLASPPSASGNTILVGHRPAFDALGEIKEGEAYVFRSIGEGGYALIGKVLPNEWSEALIDISLLGLSRRVGTD